MKWDIFADVLKSVAAGVTAVIAILKFIQELRRQGKPPSPDEPDIQMNTFSDKKDEKESNQ